VGKTFVRSAAARRRDEEVVAVADFSLGLAVGETVALVGESGAGKSTVGRMILGLEQPDEGQIVFEGTDLAGLRGRAQRGLRRRMHLILQNPYESLHPGMRVAEAAGEPLAIAGVDRAERVTRVSQALEDVALSPASQFLERYPHELSGGQRQRVSLARAFVAEPRLIVADEPTSMLDASLRGEILGLMLGMRERLMTAFVFITHDLAVAHQVSDRVAVMRDGRVVESGPTGQVIAEPQHQYTKMLIAASEGELLEEDTT
jgi:ABC-type glutathione transport system ATPase component